MPNWLGRETKEEAQVRLIGEIKELNTPHPKIAALDKKVEGRKQLTPQEGALRATHKENTEKLMEVKFKEYQKKGGDQTLEAITAPPPPPPKKSPPVTTMKAFEDSVRGTSVKQAETRTSPEQLEREKFVRALGNEATTGTKQRLRK